MIPNPYPTLVTANKFVLTAKKCLPTALDAANTKYLNFAVYYNTYNGATSQQINNTVLVRNANGSIGATLPTNTRKFDVVNFFAIDEDLAVLEVARSIGDANYENVKPVVINGTPATFSQSLEHYGYRQSSLTATTSYGILFGIFWPPCRYWRAGCLCQLTG